MYDELVRRLRDSEHEIDCSLCDRNCCYPDGKVHGKCIIIEAADAIEAQDRHILTLQHEMMAEAESHIAEVNRLNKQIEVLSKMEKTTRWVPVTERLPKQEKRTYWICTDSGHQCECRWTNNIYNIFGIGESDEWAWNIADVPQYHKVMAWMFLPEPYEPPKEESS